jgi:hypothetical protein
MIAWLRIPSSRLDDRSHRKDLAILQFLHVPNISLTKLRRNSRMVSAVSQSMAKEIRSNLNEEFFSNTH